MDLAKPSPDSCCSGEQAEKEIHLGFRHRSAIGTLQEAPQQAFGVLSWMLGHHFDIHFDAARRCARHARRGPDGLRVLRRRCALPVGVVARRAAPLPSRPRLLLRRAASSADRRKAGDTPRLALHHRAGLRLPSTAPHSPACRRAAPADSHTARPNHSPACGKDACRRCASPRLPPGRFRSPARWARAGNQIARVDRFCPALDA